MNTPYKMKGPSLLKMTSALKSKPTKDKVKNMRKKNSSKLTKPVVNERLKSRKKTVPETRNGLTGVVGGKKVTLNSEQLKNIGVE